MANTFLILLGIFLIELILLSFFSKLLINSLSRVFYLWTRSHTKTVTYLALLFLPGTIIHELSHLMVAGVSMVEVGDMEFMPEIREDGVKLGSAQIGQSDPFRRALIGIAPFLVGIGLLIGSMVFVLLNTSLVSVLIVIYILFEVSNTMFSSKKDLEGLLGVVGILVGLVVALGVTNVVDWMGLVGKIATADTIQFITKADLLMIFPVFVDLAIFVITHLSTRKHYR